MQCVLYNRLVRPLLLAALNVDPPKGFAILAGAILRGTILAGGKACRPLIAPAGLSQVLVEPAITLLLQKNANICFEHELHGLTIEKDRVEKLKFCNAEAIMLGEDDIVVMAVPPWCAKVIIPNVTTPTKFSAIVSAHFKFVLQGSSVPLIGIIGGITDWLFTFDDRLSVTISNAERFLACHVSYWPRTSGARCARP